MYCTGIIEHEVYGQAEVDTDRVTSAGSEYMHEMARWHEDAKLHEK
jgi:hypothetical protein